MSDDQQDEREPDEDDVRLEVLAFFNWLRTRYGGDPRLFREDA